MVRSGTVATVLAASLCTPLPAGQETGGAEILQEREHSNCFLSGNPEREVWLYNLFVPQVGIEMDIPYPTPPSTRLSPHLARQLAPLLAEIEERGNEKSALRLRMGKSSAVLLHLLTEERRIFRAGGVDRNWISEATAARIVHAEILTPDWFTAWEDLADSLRRTVAASLGAPGEEKRLLLAGAIETGSRALHRMEASSSKARASDLTGRVQKIDRRARIVSTFHRDVVRRWGGRLRRYADRLRMKPSTPFPEEMPEAPLLEILAGSSSGVEFVKKVREKWGAEGLEEKVPGSYRLGRDIHGWEVEGFSAGEFEKARAAVEKELEHQKFVEKMRAGHKPESISILPWGVEVGEADSDVLAEKLALKGILVLQEYPGGSKVGLRAGDLILDYTGLGDADSGTRDFPYASTLSLLQERARAGGTAGELRVIRGQQVVPVLSESTPEERHLGPCYLLDSGGAVWTKELHVYLGMFSSMAFPPRYRLGPELNRTLAPLVTRIREGESNRLPSWWNLPRVEKPIVLLLFEGKVRLAEMSWTTRQEIYEIISVRFLSAEFLTPEWLRAFEALDGALRELVQVSREAPGEEKRNRLTAAVTRGTAALEAMSRSRETEEMRSLLARIEPKARIAREFSSRISREWGGWLKNCSAALGLEPPRPFPEARDHPPVLEILIAASTPEEFLSKVREQCGEEGLEERFLYSSTLHRTVASWEIEDMAPELFASLREEALKAVEDRRAWEAKRKKSEAEPDSWEMPQWGVRLRKAGPETRKKALFIRGAVVEEVFPEGSPVGLERGDLIADYDGIYEIVMGGTEIGGLRRFLKLKQESGRLQIIRGNRVVMVDLSKK